MHQKDVCARLPLMQQLFDVSKRSLVSALSAAFPCVPLGLGPDASDASDASDAALDTLRTIKLQYNEGEGGCFPCHYDNPGGGVGGGVGGGAGGGTGGGAGGGGGGGSRRALTCVFYLNREWAEGDGGELTLLPFLAAPVSLPPLFNRMAIFSSE